ncbi:MAG: transcription-repair coupling factor [Chlamydiae bacterium]|nr:transcription-repair coupling factor [Chlamydiota bacterium]
MSNQIIGVNPFLKSNNLQKFSEAVAKEPSLLIEGLWDSPKACLLHLILEATGKKIAVISGETRENLLMNDLNYFGVQHFQDFPAWDTFPGEEIPPSLDIIGKRFEVLYKLIKNPNSPFILFCSLQACLQKISHPSHLSSLCQIWKVGQHLTFSSLPEKLTLLGYQKAAVASLKGEFALRGGIIDIFPISSPQPFRIEFLGDTIESIRSYDPSGQKSVEKVDQFFLSPVDESKLLLEQKELSSLFDYLDENVIVIFDGLLELEDRYVNLQKFPAVRSRFFFTFEELFSQINSLQKIFFSDQPVESLSEVEISKRVGRSYYTGEQPLQPLSFEIFHQKISAKRWTFPFMEIGDFFSLSQVEKVKGADELLQGIHAQAKSSLELHIITSTESEENSFKAKIKEQQILLPEKTIFERGYLSRGFVLSDCMAAFFPMTELTHKYQIRREKWRSSFHAPVAEFHELIPGDLVVHFHQGIGKYLGIEKRPNHQGVESEFLVIEYAENSKLYVPMNSAHLVSKYIGSSENEVVSLNQIGGQRWQKQLLHAQKTIMGYAKDLLEVSAEREIHGGYSFSEDSSEMESFERDFPFPETEDQITAIAAIKKDMISKKAMDRLLCGDVGYGKTEVAMRAAFKAITDGKKQVAVLVPTTVLAMQHFETFSERMANYPVQIAVLSRFISPKQMRENLQKIEKGVIDIVIGTHRLIGKDVKFKDLGLIIIDEEQRFGVRAKEYLKKIKTGVDCLTLSATPIPRTLYLSIMGAKDISTIYTPPQDRLPIKTYVAEKEPSLIQNALMRELARDGQAFYIHNRVETIFKVKEELQKILPQALIGVAHGQMHPDEIDTIFHAFKTGKIDILVSTTIIENGIDIPNANTILIEHAEQFGLADLYQMRGRVGRWNRPAFAYFLIPKGKVLLEKPQKRLKALLEASGFASGIKIAMKDLEIRGAGDILGTEQSGQVSSIGFHLYCKLLKRTIAALRQKSSPRFVETKMEFSFDAKFPETYIPEPSLRMELYHRLGDATSLKEIDHLLVEIEDRFGKPPPPVIWLYHLSKIRLIASEKQYISLKFERFTFTAEKKKEQTIDKKVFPLPPTKNPKEFEEQVVKLLE